MGFLFGCIIKQFVEFPQSPLSRLTTATAKQNKLYHSEVEKPQVKANHQFQTPTPKAAWSIYDAVRKAPRPSIAFNCVCPYCTHSNNFSKPKSLA